MGDLKSGCQRCQFSDKALGRLIMCSRLSMFVNHIYRHQEMLCPQHFHNTFTTNLKWQFVTGCYWWDKNVNLMIDSNYN